MTTDPESSELQAVCTVVVLYDGDAARTRALSACDYLVGQFWQDLELKFHWWRVDFLQDPSLAQIAGDDAVAADFLLVSCNDERGVAAMLEVWCESWLARRSGERGALVELRSTENSRRAAPSLLTKLFHEICERGGFDYLTSVHEQERAPRAAVALDEVLGETRPPSHYGLNE